MASPRGYCPPRAGQFSCPPRSRALFALLTLQYEQSVLIARSRCCPFWFHAYSCMNVDFGQRAGSLKRATCRVPCFFMILCASMVFPWQRTNQDALFMLEGLYTSLTISKMSMFFCVPAGPFLSGHTSLSNPDT